ncbi:GPW/gp25 family protein [Sedimenticola hydrogenitrophicus]|uniref:GPW/gp25 family protein n=1 Tax=Sedimenticola hydrogenitrophicus TaxID=2967975 RepID=UPI002FFA8384
MQATTGRTLDGFEHIRQSIADILTTPIGSRVMRRDYGSGLFRLLDAPITSATILALYAATADALMRWEPRIQLHRIQLDMTQAEQGGLKLIIDGRTVDGDVSLEVSL